jgi:predicted nucleic acid-binding protein
VKLVDANVLLMRRRGLAIHAPRRELLTPLGTAGNLAGDTHLAALAIGHGAEQCSADADFGRFPGLEWSNPLI